MKAEIYTKIAHRVRVLSFEWVPASVSETATVEAISRRCSDSRVSC